MTRQIDAALAQLRRKVGRMSTKRPVVPRQATGPGDASLVHAARVKLRELDLELPSPFSADALCALVSKRRGRPIVIHESSALTLDVNVPCGLWIELDDVDNILVAKGATPSHRDHIVVHELAHVLYNHQGVTGKNYLSLTVPNLSPALIRRVLGRGSYGPHEEQQAEVLASVIMEQVGREQESHADGHDREVLLGLSQMFE